MASATSVVQAFKIKAERGMTRAFRLATLELFTRIVQRSPVDTGAFRGSWRVSIGARDDSAPGLSLAETLTQGAGVIKALKFGDVVYISNSQPYARVIEYGQYREGPNTVGGFSRQAPRGVVRVTFAEWPQIWAAAVSAASTK